MKNKVLNSDLIIIIFFLFFQMFNKAQTLLKVDSSMNVNNVNPDANNHFPFALAGNYKLPPADFIVFNLENDYGKLYTGKINMSQLQRDAGFAICCMGRIPRIGVTYYNKGYQSGFVQVGSTQFASEIKEVRWKTDTLNNLSAYEAKRDSLLENKNVYILEEATIGYNKYFNVCFSNVDKPDDYEGRLYTRLANMKSKKFKGYKADFYFHSFETLDDFLDANGNNIYKVKLYYWDFPNDISTDEVLNQERSKAIFGRDYILKSYWDKNNEYTITWFEY